MEKGESIYFSLVVNVPSLGSVKDPRKRIVIITSRIGQRIFPSLDVNFWGSRAIISERTKKTTE